MKIVTPNKYQQRWADAEVGVIIHLDMSTFVSSYENKVPPLDAFTAKSIDTDQWLETAKKAGAKYAVLTAKHGSGFCLWPTKEHDYHIGSVLPGHDIVKEFIGSCKKYDILPGLYYNLVCNYYAGVPEKGQVLPESRYTQEEYEALILNQIRELWGNYGELFEIWFDGGVTFSEEINKLITNTLNTLQPNVIAFQGPKGANMRIRWVGNEMGEASHDCYATSNLVSGCEDGTVEQSDRGNPFGAEWMSAEGDIPSRDWHKSYLSGWIYHDDSNDLVYTGEHLFNKYLHTVGRNCNFLIGLPINKEGLAPEAEIREFSDFKARVDKAFGCKLTQCSGNGNVLELEVGSNIKYIQIMEDISLGERVLDFELIGINGESSDVIFKGGCIGHKRIVENEGYYEKIKLIINESKDTPHIKELSVF